MDWDEILWWFREAGEMVREDEAERAAAYRG